MKKINKDLKARQNIKLLLRAETIAVLGMIQLQQVGGGGSSVEWTCDDICSKPH